MSDPDQKTVIDLWNAEENTSARYGKGFHWVESPQALAYIQRRMSGDPGLSWGQHFINNYLQKNRGHYTGLSLGCGTGRFEMDLQKQGLFKRLDAFDIADLAIAQARASAEREHLSINFQIADLNTIHLEPEVYDIIVANSSLHHLCNLEHVISQMHRGLRLGGHLGICEYVGPSQFQYPPAQTEIINELLALLPRKYRARITSPSELKPDFHAPSVEYMNHNDPSEAIRAAEIVPLLKQRFAVVEDRPFGGTILHMFLQDIAGNFPPEDPVGDTLIKYIIYIEDLLLRRQLLSSDFTYMVFEKQ
jgi:ubiquinone/menaquinone biosynthesis C-methylase UbiE